MYIIHNIIIWESSCIHAFCTAQNRYVRCGCCCRRYGYGIVVLLITGRMLDGPEWSELLSNEQIQFCLVIDIYRVGRSNFQLAKYLLFSDWIAMQWQNVYANADDVIRPWWPRIYVCITNDSFRFSCTFCGVPAFNWAHSHVDGFDDFRPNSNEKW